MGSSSRLVPLLSRFLVRLAATGTPVGFANRLGPGMAIAFMACAAPAKGPPNATAIGSQEPARGKGPAAEATPSTSGATLQAPPAEAAQGVKLELVTDESRKATDLVAAPGHPGLLFVVEKEGLVRVLEGGRFRAEPFLDLRGKVALDGRDNGEQGLLGLAFHPRFAENGRFYINFTAAGNGATRVEERRVIGKRPKAKPGAVKLLMEVPQPYRNHNAGDLTFGPDGKLYVGLGDGGAANDPHGHGQNAETLLGSLLRFDVDAATPTPEVVAIGLRNPWRIAFDPKTGDLYIADVGQNRYEYVHLLTARQLSEGKAPYNLGWNVMEGLHCFQDKPCDPSKYQKPILEYPHTEGCSITGGFVYRGHALPALRGQYFYADYCTALIRSLSVSDGALRSSWDWKQSLDPESQLARISTFGVDEAGELYVATHEGPIFKFVPAGRDGS